MIGEVLTTCMCNDTGEMSDAGEVLMALYEHLILAARNTEKPKLLHVIFGLHVQV